MKIAAYREAGKVRTGILTADLQGILPVVLSDDQHALGGICVIEHLAEKGVVPSTGAPVALGAVQLLAPIPRPRRNIFCVGKNYHAHAKEFAGSGCDSSAKAGGDIPEHPIIFTKVPESVVGPGDGSVLSIL